MAVAEAGAPERGQRSEVHATLLCLFLLPALHPLLRPLLGPPSHLLWWVHVLPVAMYTYRLGRRWGGAALAVSALLVVVGERTFGHGYGHPAPWVTVLSLTGWLLLTNLLVAGFADYARSATRRLRYNALHDALTGLPNRRLFMDRLEQRIERSRRRPESRFAVLFLDLDRFKILNDSLGHSVGDEVLEVVARRVERCVRGEDTVARWGGDEFVILLEEAEGPDDAVQVTDRIRESIEEPLEAAGHEVVVSASVGVAVGGAGAEAAEELVRDADTAMYRAKNAGRGEVGVFDRSMHREAVTRLTVESELRRAVEGDELVVHYQPVVRLEDEGIVGFEALVRWDHPDRGLLLPGEFIGVAEDSGLVVPLGRIVMEKASEALADWSRRRRGGAGLTMSVNVSTRQVTRADFSELVAGLCESCGIPSRQLQIEVTETAFTREAELVVGALERVREQGVRVSLDDFGTGYSSLAYLHRFPVDVLKVDRSFVSGEGGRGRHWEIVQTIVALAEDLGLDTVAEGVETREQADALRALGCTYAQGYLFHRPMPPEEAERLLADGTQRGTTAAR